VAPHLFQQQGQPVGSAQAMYGMPAPQQTSTPAWIAQGRPYIPVVPSPTPVVAAAADQIQGADLKPPSPLAGTPKQAKDSSVSADDLAEFQKEIERQQKEMEETSRLLAEECERKVSQKEAEFAQQAERKAAELEQREAEFKAELARQVEQKNREFAEQTKQKDLQFAQESEKLKQQITASYLDGVNKGATKPTPSSSPPVTVPQSDGSSASPKTDPRPQANTSRTGSGHWMKPEKFDGVMDWMEYKRQFEVVAKINRWTLEEKALYLAGSLTGAARSILYDLSETEMNDWDAVIRKIEGRYDAVGRDAAYQSELRSRMCKADQSPQEWASDVTKLVNKAYPSLPSIAIEAITKENFLRGLPAGQMKIATEVSRPKTVEDAVNYVVHYESVTVPNAATVVRKPKEVAPVIPVNAVSPEETIDGLDALVAAVTQYRNQGQSEPYRNGNRYEPRSQLTPRPAQPAPEVDNVKRLTSQLSDMHRRMDDMVNAFRKWTEVPKVPEKRPDLRTGPPSGHDRDFRTGPSSQDPKTNQSPSLRDPLTCWHCQRTGHVKRECPVRSTVGMVDENCTCHCESISNDEDHQTHSYPTGAEHAEKRSENY